MKTIAIANHKGGCAKTTTALNVAVTLANTGSHVLAVDLDPQGNLSASLGVDLQELEENHHTAHRLRSPLAKRRPRSRRSWRRTRSQRPVSPSASWRQK